MWVQCLALPPPRWVTWGELLISGVLVCSPTHLLDLLGAVDEMVCEKARERCRLYKCEVF